MRRPSHCITVSLSHRPPPRYSVFSARGPMTDDRPPTTDDRLPSHRRTVVPPDLCASAPLSLCRSGLRPPTTGHRPPTTGLPSHRRTGPRGTEPQKGRGSEVRGQKTDHRSPITGLPSHRRTVPLDHRPPMTDYRPTVAPAYRPHRPLISRIDSCHTGAYGDRKLAYRSRSSEAPSRCASPGEGTEASSSARGLVRAGKS